MEESGQTLEELEAMYSDEDSKKKKPKGAAAKKQKGKQQQNSVQPAAAQPEATTQTLEDLEAMYSDEEKSNRKAKAGKAKKAPAGNGVGEKANSADAPQEKKADASKPLEGDAEKKELSAAQKKKLKKKEKEKKSEETKTDENAEVKKVEEKKPEEKKAEEKKAEEKKAEEKKPDEKKAEEKADTEKTAAGDEDEAEDELGEGKPGEKKELTAAQKKKLKKKEKEKEKKAAAASGAPQAAAEGAAAAGKKPSAVAKLIKQQLEKQREEEEKQRRLEEEAERKREEERLRREEEERLERERKERRKQKEKERKKRLKEEGKLLTQKQKQDRQRLQQMIQMGGVEVPWSSVAGAADDAGALETPEESERQLQQQQKKKPKYVKLKRPRQPAAGGGEQQPTTTEQPTTLETSAQQQQQQKPVVADSWEDAMAAEDTWSKIDSAPDEWKAVQSPQQKQHGQRKASGGSVVNTDDDEGDSDGEDGQSGEASDSDDDDSGSASGGDADGEPEADPIERAKQRIAARRDAAVAHAESLADSPTAPLRCPLVCVLGHVDTGKTSILDKLRKTHVQDGEAGGITQQIGATNVPAASILAATRMVKSLDQDAMSLPGLLIIDTPGHESFSNLRSRGSSLCDVAILVVDIMHGIEPQTVESIQLLKQRATPFIVALNKIDRLYDWQKNPTADVYATLKKQSPATKNDFQDRLKLVVQHFAMQELNVCLSNENRNMDEYVSLVPTSAHSGDGMGNLMAHICELSLRKLRRQLIYREDLEATVMEVKEITGLGTTIDVCLVNGSLNEGDTIVLAGQEGPIVTQVRALLMPMPMKEMRVKNQYDKFKTVKGAQAVKLIAKDLEKALAGLPIYSTKDPDEIEVYKMDVSAKLSKVLKSIEVQDIGVYVQASTLGSLEALLLFLRTEKIPYCGINIGPVHKRDVTKCSIMLEKDPQWAVILAFDVKVEREAQELADKDGVRIFTADIIYHLSDAFMKWRDDRAKAEREKYKDIAVFPCKLRILPQFIFNTRDPIVCGVTVEAGILKVGTPIAVPSKECVFLGKVESLEMNHKKVEEAKRGAEVCIKIAAPPGEAPKLYGRHFDHNDMLMSRVSRDSIDALKQYFRDDLTKDDWKLVIELKKAFNVM